MSSIALYLPAETPLVDPGPELTSQREVSLVSAVDQDTIAIIGWSDGGIPALKAASQNPSIPRLAIVATPFREESLEEFLFDDIVAKTLLVYGSKDPRTGHHHGSSWQKALPNARLEMLPGGGHDILTDRWKRIMSHCAPGRGSKKD